MRGIKDYFMLGSLILIIVFEPSVSTFLPLWALILAVFTLILGYIFFRYVGEKQIKYLLSKSAPLFFLTSSLSLTLLLISILYNFFKGSTSVGELILQGVIIEALSLFAFISIMVITGAGIALFRRMEEMRYLHFSLMSFLTLPVISSVLYPPPFSGGDIIVDSTLGLLLLAAFETLHTESVAKGRKVFSVIYITHNLTLTALFAPLPYLVWKLVQKGEKIPLYSIIHSTGFYLTSLAVLITVCIFIYIYWCFKSYV